jgi:hypothetical protein
LRENLHQSNPPITIIVTPKTSPRPDLREGGDCVSAISGVPVGEGVREGLGVGVIVMGIGVSVAVAGGATSRINFCPGRMTEALFNPFQDIKSARGTPYQPAIQESVSPLLTV